MPIVDDYNKLERDSIGATCRYLASAVEAIDGQFGSGFAKDNPDLVAAFIKSCAHEYAAVVNAKAVESGAQSISSSLIGGIEAIDSAINRAK